MRDAFGGAFLIKLLLIFLAIYISFMAIALNYAKAFRVKNQIINLIEQYEGYSDEVEGLIDDYLNGVSYFVEANEKKADDNAICYNRGYCISELRNENRGTYYKIYTFITINFPFFNLNFTIPIKGETRVVTNV